MATYMPSPGPFKGADADPEATLELFEDYLDKMEKVFRLSRGFNPVTGVKVDWNSEEKKDLLLVEGGDEVTDLFKHVGKVLQEDNYQQAVDKVKNALKKRGNRTSAVSSSSTPTPRARSRLTCGTKRFGRLRSLSTGRTTTLTRPRWTPS